MRFVFFAICFFYTAAAQAASFRDYVLEDIKQVLDGRFGAKKLYFDVACNQEFLQVLNQESGQGSLNVGILTMRLSQECEEPVRRVFVRFSPYGRTVNPVSKFDEVWLCIGSCFTPGGPDMPPYNRAVQAYGTSERQATEYLGCTEPYLQDLRCEEIKISQTQ